MLQFWLCTTIKVEASHHQYRFLISGNLENTSTSIILKTDLRTCNGSCIIPVVNLNSCPWTQTKNPKQISTNYFTTEIATTDCHSIVMIIAAMKVEAKELGGGGGDQVSRQQKKKKNNKINYSLKHIPALALWIIPSYFRSAGCIASPALRERGLVGTLGAPPTVNDVTTCSSLFYMWHCLIIITFQLMGHGGVSRVDTIHPALQAWFIRLIPVLPYPRERGPTTECRPTPGPTLGSSSC